MAVHSIRGDWRNLPKSAKLGDYCICGDGTAHAVLEDGSLVPFTQLLAVKQGPAGEPGPRGRNGSSVAPAEVEAIVRKVIAEKSEELRGPRGVQGKDGKQGPPGDVIGDAEMARAFKKLRSKHAAVIARIVSTLESKDGANGLVKIHFRKLLTELQRA